MTERIQATHLPVAPHGRGQGFSLVEVLVAVALLFFIVMGVLPLFTQALVSNQSGRESTEASNFGRSRAEETVQLDFDAPTLTVDTGTTKVIDNYYSIADREWKPGTAPVADPALWTRATTVRQYNVDALVRDAAGKTPILQASALDASADPQNVHLKEIEILLQGTRLGGPFGPSKQITIRSLKAQ